MVAEYHPFIGRNKIATVVQALCWRGPGGVHREHAGGNPSRVKTVSDGVNAGCCRYKPHGTDALAAV